MKTVLVPMFLLALCATPALADLGQPADQPAETAEILAIGAGTMSALFNIRQVAAGTPSYLMGSIGVGLGATTLLLTTVEDPAHRTGLVVSGAFAIATGLVTMRYRYVLDHSSRQARIEPTWNDGGPAMALVIDF